MTNNNPVELTMVVIHETDKAYLMTEVEDQDGMWIPKSQITDLRETGRTKPNAILGHKKLKRTDDDGGVDDPTGGRTIRPSQAESGSNRTHNRIFGATSPWSDSDLIPCADGKARRVKSGLPVLAHGVRNRVGRLRAYGNSIVPQVAAVFIRAAMM